MVSPLAAVSSDMRHTCRFKTHLNLAQGGGIYGLELVNMVYIEAKESVLPASSLGASCQSTRADTD